MATIRINSGGPSTVKVNEPGQPSSVTVNTDPTPPSDLDRTVGEFGSNGTYDGMGNSVTVSSTKAIHCFRQGASHLGNGRVVLMDLNLVTKVWSNRRIVYPSGVGYDVRDPRIMIVNGSLFIFFCTADTTNADRPTLFAGYIKSTDGLTGSTWASAVSLPLANNCTVPWGKGFSGYTSGEYFHPFWSATFDNPGQIFEVGYYHTTDNGLNWTKELVYSGTAHDATESQIVKCGGTNMICVSRLENYFGNTSGIGQSVSTDGGETWSAMARTNLGSNVLPNVVALWYHETWGKLICIYQDRSDDYLKISITTPASVLSNPLGWTAPQNYQLNADTGSVSLGYPDIEPIGDDVFLVTWGFETSGNAWMKFRYDDFRMFD